MQVGGIDVKVDKPTSTFMVFEDLPIHPIMDQEIIELRQVYYEPRKLDFVISKGSFMSCPEQDTEEPEESHAVVISGLIVTAIRSRKIVVNYLGDETIKSG